MKRPNFFIVGEPKSGTTTLYELLKVHPDIFMPEEKEPSYFSKDFISESIAFYGENLFFHHTQEDSYLELFKPAQNKKAIGEATTRYLYSKVAAKEIYNFDSNAKIIMMFREPVDLLHSLHSQFLSNSFEIESDFEKALGLEEKRKRGEFIHKMAKFPSVLYYRERVKFSEHVQRFLNVFPKDQIFIIIFDDFRADMKDIYKKVLDFLEVDPEFKPNFQISNVNNQPIFRAVFNKLQSPRFKMFFWKILPQPVFSKIRNFLEKLFLRPVKRPPLEDSLRQKLKKEFLPEVKAINALLNGENFIHCDLVKLWGYNTLDE